jgi:hypothetical protein
MVFMAVKIKTWFMNICYYYQIKLFQIKALNHSQFWEHTLSYNSYPIIIYSLNSNKKHLFNLNYIFQ